MPTPHNTAQKGDYAPICLLPGDPLRAKYIAETFFTEAKLVNSVRNCLGYTGFYKGHPVSVQATGMGVPSLSIYVNELASQYGVKTMIRTGTCGAFDESLQLKDIILAEGASTDSGIAPAILGPVHIAPIADFDLLYNAYTIAKEKDIKVRVGNVFAADRFYDDTNDYAVMSEYGILAAEMESSGLYLLGAKLGFKALSILAVTDLIITRDEHLTADERVTAGDQIIELALETGIKANAE